MIVINLLCPGVVAALDQSVGRVVDTLKTANMLNNSIIVFISDNGAMSDGYLRNYGSNHPLRGVTTIQKKSKIYYRK